MSDPRRGKPPIDETHLLGQDFLEAQTVKIPESVLEMQEASQQSFMQVEARLGDTETFEAWVDVTSDLEEVFFEEAEGTLGARLIELVSLNEATFEQHRVEAEALVRQTAHAASRLYPIIHRLQTLAFGSTREEVVRKLETGEVLKTVCVNNVSIVPVRRTIIGLLRDLDRRVDTNLWSLEYPPTLPSSVVVSDPFDAKTAKDYWRGYLLAKREVAPTETHSLLTISHDKTKPLRTNSTTLSNDPITQPYETPHKHSWLGSTAKQSTIRILMYATLSCITLD